jgi:hypothetical protein
MLAFFSFLLGLGATGAQLGYERHQINKAQAEYDAIQATRKAQNLPKLWPSMIESYTPPEMEKWDGRTWCYKNKQTGEYYTDYAFKTEHDIQHGGAMEAQRRHAVMARSNPVVYCGSSL